MLKVVSAVQCIGRRWNWFCSTCVEPNGLKNPNVGRQRRRLSTILQIDFNPDVRVQGSRVWYRKLGQYSIFPAQTDIRPLRSRKALPTQLQCGAGLNQAEYSSSTADEGEDCRY